jgi:hypothetical protein
LRKLLFKLAIICAASALIGACSPIQVRPEPQPQYTYKTPLKDASAQLILSQEFQRRILTQSPAYGDSWRHRDFEIVVGAPLSKLLAEDLRSRIPTAAVGDTDNGMQSTVKLKPGETKLEFGVDDSKAMGFMGLSPIIGSGVDAVVGAKLRLTATVESPGKPAEQIEVTGTGSLPVTFIAIRESDVSKAISLALVDAAQKLIDAAEVRAKSP